MVHEATTNLEGATVLAHAKHFFAERVPHNAAYPEKEGPGFLVLRGQGGEEVALAVFPQDGVTGIRASSMFFDQAIMRFLSSLRGLESAG